MSQQCCKKIGTGWHRSQCSKNGKVEVDGKWYCGTHDPAAVERRRQKSDERYRKWRTEQDEKYAREAYDRKAGDVCRQLSLTDPKELLSQWQQITQVNP